MSLAKVHRLMVVYPLFLSGISAMFSVMLFLQAAAWFAAVLVASTLIVVVFFEIPEAIVRIARGERPWHRSFWRRDPLGPQ